jgi:hypothetical protein
MCDVILADPVILCGQDSKVILVGPSAISTKTAKQPVGRVLFSWDWTIFTRPADQLSALL